MLLREMPREMVGPGKVFVAPPAGVSRRRDAQGAGFVGMVGHHVLLEVPIVGVPFAAEAARLGLGPLAPFAGG